MPVDAAGNDSRQQAARPFVKAIFLTLRQICASRKAELRPAVGAGSQDPLGLSIHINIALHARFQQAAGQRDCMSTRPEATFKWRCPRCRSHLQAEQAISSYISASSAFNYTARTAVCDQAGAECPGTTGRMGSSRCVGPLLARSAAMERIKQVPGHPPPRIGGPYAPAPDTDLWHFPERPHNNIRKGPARALLPSPCLVIKTA